MAQIDPWVSPYKKDLEFLSLRAAVAFAARSVRRVRPLFKSMSDGDGQRVVEETIAFAERFAAGGTGVAADPIASFTVNPAAFYTGIDPDIDVINAASWAATAVIHAEAASRSTDIKEAGGVVNAAEQAIAWSTNAFAYADAETRAILEAAIRSDLVHIVMLDCGKFPDLGKPIDPSESGPLGSLWPQGVPDWVRKSSLTETKRFPVDSAKHPAFVIVWDPELVSEEDYAGLVAALGNLVRAEGGDGVRRIQSKGYGVPCEAGVTL